MANIPTDLLGSSLAWRKAKTTSSREAKEKAYAKALKILLCSSSSPARTRRLYCQRQDWRIKASSSSSSASDSATSKCFLIWVFPFVNSTK
nr:hypothetical protein CFP56_06563 [Quercus suber]